MRSLIVISSILFLLSCQSGKDHDRSHDEHGKHSSEESHDHDKDHDKIDQNNGVYDASLAAELGADQYGMSSYFMAFLKAGPNRDRDTLEAVQLQRAHLDNMKILADDGKLVLAGPFLDDGELRGIYIFSVDTFEEAKALVETDPAVKAGSLIMELKPWYGSAALNKITEIHKMIAQEEI